MSKCLTHFFSRYLFSNIRQNTDRQGEGHTLGYSSPDILVRLTGEMAATHHPGSRRSDFAAIKTRLKHHLHQLKINKCCVNEI